MPKKNILFGAIECLQTTKQSSEAMINQAEKKQNKEHHFYYVIRLPKSPIPLEFANGQTFHCTELHTTFFAGHETNQRESDLHCTAIFHNNEDNAYYRFRVFLNEKDEPTGDISWYKLDLEHHTEEAVPLTLEHFNQIVNYALLHSSPVLTVLRSEHKTLLERERTRYQHKLAQYHSMVFADSMNTEALLACLQEALSSLDILDKIDDTRYKSERMRLLQILAFIEHPPVTAAASASAAMIEAHPVPECIEHNPNLPTKTAQLVDKPAPDCSIAWEALTTKADLLLNDYATIPLAITESKINSAYITAMTTLDQAYRALCKDYLILEQQSLVFTRAQQQFDIRFDTLQEKHSATVTQCLKTMLMFSSSIENIDDLLQQFSTYASKLDPNIFRVLINKDRAELLTFLLEHFPFQTTLLYSKEHQGLHSRLIHKTILEEIIDKRATHCLRTILKENYHLNLLTLGSDGRPLASHILRLDLLNDFRFICVRDIPAFSSASFYKALLTLLQRCPNAQDDIDKAQIARNLYKRSSSIYKLAEQNMEIIHNLPEDMKTAIAQITALAHGTNQIKFIRLRQIGQEINNKIALLAQDNPQLQRRLSEEMGRFYTELCQVTADDPAAMLDAFSHMTHKQLDTILDQQLSYCHELNEFLYYSLPADPRDQDSLSTSARLSLRNHHLQRLQTTGIMLKDPLERLRDLCKKMSEAMQGLGDALSRQAVILQRIQDAKDSGNDISLQDVREICEFGKALSTITLDLPNPNEPSQENTLVALGAQESTDVQGLGRSLG